MRVGLSKQRPDLAMTKYLASINPGPFPSRPLAKTERRANMAKTLFAKRTPKGTEVAANTLACALRHLKKTEKRHGQASRKTNEAYLLLAAMYCVVEDYGEAEPLLKKCIATAKNKLPQNADVLFWASSLLAEAYCGLNRILEAMMLTSEMKPLSRSVNPSAPDLVFESLWHLAMSFEAKGDTESRQQGLAVALMALCWSITHGLYRTQWGAQALDHLRLHFSTYGIVLDRWNWLVKHAHLTKYDFIGLLSIVLHNPDPPPVSVKSWMEREPRVIEVR
jgi:hypothetical protein